MRLFTVLALTALLAGCGGDESESPPAQQPAQPAEQQPAAQQPTQEPVTEPGSEPAEPEPEAAPEPEPEPGTRVGDQRLFSVQVAAFLNAATAREWADRLRGQDMPVWTSTATVGGRTFHRLRIGALPELTDTRRLADMIRDRYGWPVWVAPLTASDRLPVNAVQQTRELVRSGR